MKTGKETFVFFKVEWFTTHAFGLEPIFARWRHDGFIKYNITWETYKQPIQTTTKNKL